MWSRDHHTRVGERPARLEEGVDTSSPGKDVATKGDETGVRGKDGSLFPESRPRSGRVDGGWRMVDGGTKTDCRGGRKSGWVWTFGERRQDSFPVHRCFCKGGDLWWRSRVRDGPPGERVRGTGSEDKEWATSRREGTPIGNCEGYLSKGSDWTWCGESETRL